MLKVSINVHILLSYKAEYSSSSSPTYTECTSGHIAVSYTPCATSRCSHARLSLSLAADGLAVLCVLDVY